MTTEPGTTSPKPMTILLVDDHQIVRHGVKQLLPLVFTEQPLLFTEAGTLGEAIEQVNCGPRPDLILLDVHLPDSTEANEAHCISQLWKGIPVIIVSSSNDWQVAKTLVRAGATGFIPKTSDINIMVHALRLILAGGTYFPPEMILPNSVAPQPLPIELTSTGQRPELSPRQQEVFELMSKGFSNKEIAKSLEVSVGTIKNHVASILRIYNTNSRAKALVAGTPGT